ncbi:MAG: hypothetical protein M3O62_14700, partial [Pseudomonadota bacterium]|nr:hypothetical protein [Pseudomonadota bacterium]
MKSFALFCLAGLLGTSMLASAASGPGTAGIVFTDCDLLDAAGIPRVEAQCAQFSVAENRAEPTARTLSLR